MRGLPAACRWKQEVQVVQVLVPLFAALHLGLSSLAKAHHAHHWFDCSAQR